MLAPNFSNLAPALIFTAELDPLRDEGEAYGKKLRDAGNKVELIQVKGVPHIFNQNDDILEGGKMYNREVIRALGEVFGIKPEA